jgi:hypothetical protein
MSIISKCIYCGEDFNHMTDWTAGGHHYGPDGNEYICHRECAFRMVTGGIGHWMDHTKFCKDLDDPDAGFTYRQSARLVWAIHKEEGLMPELH